MKPKPRVCCCPQRPARTRSRAQALEKAFAARGGGDHRRTSTPCSTQQTLPTAFTTKGGAYLSMVRRAPELMAMIFLGVFYERTGPDTWHHPRGRLALDR